MPKYDPNQDVPIGVAGADFPVTFYDRPQYMFGNLLQGNIDGMTRAMLSPSTMTPAQMKSVRDVLIPGAKPNKLLKTVTDIATNPLVIMGLVVGLWKFPLGTTKPLLELRKGLLPKSAAMGRMFSGLHDAMYNLRSVPGLFESLLNVTKETANFASKYWDDANQIFLKAGKLNKVDGYLVSARLDGLHKAEHAMVKTLRDEPEWLAFMGGRDVPIMPDIQTLMQARNPNLIGLSDRLRGWFTGIRSQITKDSAVKERIKKAVESRGLAFGEDVVDYFPHAGSYNKYYQQSIRGTTGVQYRKWLHKEMVEKVGREEIARHGGMFARMDELAEMEKAGMIRPGFTNMVQTITNRRSAEAASTIETIWNDISSRGLSESQERIMFIKKVKDYYTNGGGKGLNFIARLGNSKTATETLDAMAGSLQNARFKGSPGIQAELSEIGSVLASPAQYSLNPWEASGKYLSSVSSSYAWHGTGLGDSIMKTVQTPGIFREAPYLESYLMDDLIPHVRGLKSYQQLQRSLSVSVQKEKIYNWLKATPFVENALGTKTKDWLVNYFGTGPKSLSAEGLSSKISHAFYLSTLGANISPASKNLLQNFITTVNMPGIGPQGLYRGLMGVGGHEGALVKMERFIKNLSSGMEKDEAFRKAFPEYVADMGEGTKIAATMIQNDIERHGLAKWAAERGVKEKFSEALLLPFQTSEGFNRIVGYYAGRNSHLFHNAGKLAGASAEVRNRIVREAGEVGQTITMAAHFSGGPLGMPKAIMNLPSFGRQYAHFPLRMMGFLHGSLRLGMDPNKLDWGTIGRSLAGSTTVYLAARNMLGVNLESSLLSGALPIPTFENAPFYPWPIVPPAISVAGMGAKALLSGETEGLDAAAAMLIPGGVGARRLYRSLSPRYADYDNRTPDGRIPVYNNDKALVGSYTPLQLTLRALGIQTNDRVAEYGAAKWLTTQRDRIREYRRNYLQALFENDARKADSVQAEFKKAYPELGEIQVKKSDLRAMENRREISRLHRIAKGLPSAYRPIFQQVIDQASLGSMVQDIETSDLGMLPGRLQ